MEWKNSLKSLGILLALALIVTIPVQVHSKQVLDPIQTDAGYISGTMLGDIGNEVRIYRGIPYAAPPVGNLRWKPPQPVTPWSGIRECTVFGKWAPQAYPAPARYDGGMPESGMSEDCLYLNVLTSAKNTTARLPVLVWFHGGGLATQSGSMATYNSIPLAQHGAVHVTVTHRLGAIGYMVHPSLTAESETGSSGNYGQLDLIAALQWVQKNIAAFGGDPDRVTIFGQSGGGSKVTWLVASPLAKGLFHAAIVESGIGSGTPLATSEQWGVNLATKLGITGGDVLAQLRAKTWEEIINASLASDSGYSTNTTIDGWSQLDTVPNVFKAGEQQNVPLIVGMNECDIPSLYPGTKSFVANMKPVGSKIYVYLFTHVPTGYRQDGAKAWHSLETGYVFGVPRSRTGAYYALYGIGCGAQHPDPGCDELDDWMAEFMMDTWIRFAATGDPNLPLRTQKKYLNGEPIPLDKWPAYESSNDLYFKLDVVPEAKTGFSTLVHPPGGNPSL